MDQDGSVEQQHDSCFWKEERDRLLVENAQLKFLVQRLQNDIVKSTPRPRTPSDFANLPNEISLLIFDRTVAPLFLFSPAYSVRGSAQLQCVETKRCLSLVCRSWYQAATELLYRDVSFRSIGQIAAFLDTLQTTGKADLPSLVRSITVTCYVPRDVRRDRW
ncbi:hypothetical protein BD626DRAFT_21593 [Schizophyllum amplum]|uniref:Uncharacterized protein n=1 Tax=Schizophyllum amplum TaxID=97359 RepID=A0A550CYY2_9AGAR|nr:hypothetical protein BD626DRAFT_21593 [Auriculariopsis ampla]